MQKKIIIGCGLLISLLCGNAASAHEDEINIETHVDVRANSSESLRLQNTKVEQKQMRGNADIEISQTINGRDGRLRIQEMRARFGSTTPEKRESIRARFGSTTDERRLEIKGKFATARNNGIIHRVKEMMDRWTKALQRFENIAGRIETFLDKKQEAGKNVDAQVELLAAFDEKLDTAKEAMIEGDATLKLIIESEITKESGPKVKEALMKIEEAVKNARQALGETVKSLKELEPNKGELHGTSTVEIENN